MQINKNGESKYLGINQLIKQLKIPISIISLARVKFVFWFNYCIVDH